MLILLVLAMGAPAGAEARARKPRRPAAYLNMPRGWTWPPTPEMKAAGERCVKELDQLGVAWKPAPATNKVTTPIYVPSMTVRGLVLEPIWRKGPFVMDCHLALALAHHAETLQQLGVRALRFSSIHSYRNVRKRHRTWPMLSRHAIGLAMDVYEISFTDGRTLVVERDYRKEPILRQIEEALRGSHYLRGLLTPGNDPRSHHDHFHIEGDQHLEQHPVG
ncbi:MAG TPA: extensin family protein [Kofleriaceae bacterium]|nr:extensin family protein [Kofleriaceae bacterium]